MRERKKDAMSANEQARDRVWQWQKKKVAYEGNVLYGRLNKSEMRVGEREIEEERKNLSRGQKHD